MVIYLGTAGWDYNHWVGNFYPNKKTDRLKHYSQFSQMVEINSTYYRIPPERIITNWYKKTADSFIFALKMNNKITHTKEYNLNTEYLSFYFQRTSLLREKFQILLLQFPRSFKNNERTLPYLEELVNYIKSCFSGKIVMEVRNKSFFDKKGFSFLKKQDLTILETTKVKPPKEYLFTDTYYIRLLGDRNIIPDEELGNIRLNKRDELKNLANSIHLVSENYSTTYVVINNRFSGNAIDDAIILQRELSEQGSHVVGFSDVKIPRKQHSLDLFFEKK